MEAGRTCNMSVVELDAALLLGAALDCTDDVRKADDDGGADICPKVVDELGFAAMLVDVVARIDINVGKDDTALTSCENVVADWLDAPAMLGEGA